MILAENNKHIRKAIEKRSYGRIRECINNIMEIDTEIPSSSHYFKGFREKCQFDRLQRKYLRKLVLHKNWQEHGMVYKVIRSSIGKDVFYAKVLVFKDICGDIREELWKFDSIEIVDKKPLDFICTKYFAQP